ncbi:DinB family protein [Haloferula sp. BvORR071]|uniref:DinB family protein n=1 Tax=Haloferula sp. BvORR071 TaxID=1396141 RepID=UPI000558FDE7|nr:DinB family protein [Haloferula sp. BvORR071]
MNESIDEAEIQKGLEKPGAGIPWLEQKIGGLMLRREARKGSREQLLEAFCGTAEEVLQLVDGLDEGRGRKRVLIPRLRGIEDSSRYWSPYMIVEHLCRVDGPVLGLVRLLAAGKTTDRKSGPADVKPSVEAGPESLEKLRGIVAEWREHLPAAEKLVASKRHRHSWFGNLNAHQWLCMGVMHHRIHRKQLEAVLAG